ncbi:MAG TPA: dihydropteroate synthase [Legionella sp.]|nr:dihydropteroate synthase [Legionella sp.]
MGVLNRTPDSFSDGGHFLEQHQAMQRARMMIEQGADIIDVGGESSRPGAVEISCAEELARVIPIIEAIRSISDICISIDTRKALVMKAAVAAGASIINDIQALRGVDALSVAAQLDVPVCLMHMQGMPDSMQTSPHYASGILDEINLFFEQRIQACVQAGISRERLILDPGFGFGKSVEHNLTLLNGLAAFQRHGLPLLLGVSRKSTLGAITQKPVDERGPAGIAAAVFAATQGVQMIRTHDVGETNQALQMLDAIASKPLA